VELPKEKFLQAIRPCRESKTGWTPAPGDRSRRNQSSHELNEHGPALNVFWTRKSELGARLIERKHPDKDQEAFRIKKEEKLVDVSR
jgi:hypothetical protein